MLLFYYLLYIQYHWSWRSWLHHLMFRYRHWKRSNGYSPISVNNRDCNYRRHCFSSLFKALGLTEAEIKRMYSRIALVGEGFTQADLTLQVEEKRRMLRSSQIFGVLGCESY